MFTMQCKITEPHEPHVFTKRWYRVQLKFLRNPDHYPAAWNAIYQCPGIEHVSIHPELLLNKIQAKQARNNSLYTSSLKISYALKLMINSGTLSLPFSGDELTRIKRGGKLYLNSVYGKM